MRSVPTLRRIDAPDAPFGVRAPLFVASVVTSLLTALLCALLPLGLPATSTHGSAFNPSTTAVSLSAPSAARLAGKKLERDDDRADRAAPALDHALPALAVELPAPSLAHVSVAITAHETLSLAAAPRGSAWPRAPPFA